MNEKIKLLAEQAGYSKDFLAIGLPNNMEKFAELIVQECADAIANDSRLGDVRSAANGCVRTIKEHFGVDK
jgi:hypothetical protein